MLYCAFGKLLMFMKNCLSNFLSSNGSLSVCMFTMLMVMRSCFMSWRIFS